MLCCLRLVAQCVYLMPARAPLQITQYPFSLYMKAILLPLLQCIVSFIRSPVVFWVYIA